MTLLVKEPEGPREVSEEEISLLVRRAQDDDPDAFGELIELLAAKLHRQAFFLTGDEQQAHDLLQETMVEVWRHLRRYDRRARFFTWLCSVMAHRHYDWLRRLRVRSAALLRLQETVHHDPTAPSPHEGAERRERARLMCECLDQLPAKQRAVVYLRFYAGESLEGIAAIAGCSLGTVKSRLFHGLARLAKMQKLKELQDKLEPQLEPERPI